MAVRQRTIQIRQFIVENVREHPGDIVRLVAEQFGLTRQGASDHIRSLVKAGVLNAAGRTRSRRYELVPIAELSEELPVSSAMEEDIPWREDVRPLLSDVPRNIIDICSYGFTEMVNNVIDHSESSVVRIECLYTADGIELRIIDRGVGIFRNIKRAFELPDERDAVIELAKGKLTTDPTHHTGEGIFFASRLFDKFEIISGKLGLLHFAPDNDWLIEDLARSTDGTHVKMSISLNTARLIKDVFDTYTASDDTYAFSKTHVPVRLAQYGEDNLVSRSQARRVLSRLDEFDEVILDFEGVGMIGQAFADEIFRVFRNAHAATRMIPVNANDDVASMIRRAEGRNALPETRE